MHKINQLHPIGYLSFNPQSPDRPVNWVVCFRFNDEMVEEGFEFQTIAIARMLELEVLDMAPSLHQRKPNEW